MAMGIFSRNEFERELRNSGLSPTEDRSALGRLWQTEGGEVALVPDLPDGIPDFVLDRVLAEVGLLYR